MGRDQIEDDGYGSRFHRPLHRREQAPEPLGAYAMPDVVSLETTDSPAAETTVVHKLGLSEEELASYAAYSEAVLGDSPS